MQIEIAGQKGALWWEYRELWDDRILTRAHVATGGRESSMIDGTLRMADAYCSTSDKFIKDRGRKISLSRLLQSMNLSKEERRKVWEQYHNRKQGGNH